MITSSRAVVAAVMALPFWLPLACSSTSSGSGSARSASTFTLSTPTVTVKSGQERYVCYAKTLDDDLAVDKLDYVRTDAVHHVILSRATKPEVEGISECDILFRQSWLPLFVAAKGDATLEYPPGSANVLPKGTQLVVQLHLLNATSSDADVNVNVMLRRAAVANPVPVGVYAFGTQRIAVPARSTNSISYECTPTDDVDAFAMFAHMHQFGTKLTLEAQDPSGVFHEVFRRDPYDFDDQYMSKAALHIAKGTKTRVTCAYANSTAAAVGFGESTHDEMCYLVTFVAGKAGANGCVEAPSSEPGGAPDGGTCSAKANSIGVGASCTAAGNECPTGLKCSSDLQSAAAGTPGFCMKVGCASASECGEAATCCAPSQGGGVVQVCLPSACVPSDCIVK